MPMARRGQKRGHYTLAVAAGAHVITSRDRHLLSLPDTTTPAGAEFVSRFGFIEVLIQ